MTPWELSRGAIDLIVERCESRVVIEFGSGPGTERLVEAGLEVYSIEDQEQWICKSVRSTLHAPIRNGWYCHESVGGFLARIFSAVPVGAVIIDGPMGRIGRWGILHHWHQLCLAEMILIDDVHRPEEFVIANSLAMLSGRKQVPFKQDNKAFAVLMK